MNCKRYSSIVAGKYGTQQVLNSFVTLGLKFCISQFQNQSPIEKTVIFMTFSIGEMSHL